MRILLFSDVQRKGGAGIAAHRLACALRDQGHEVRWATPHPDPQSELQTDNCRIPSKFDRITKRIALTLHPGNAPAIDVRTVTRRLYQIIRQFNPDVVNVHNLHGAGLPATLPAELSRTVPVVWTLHDMWAFTGTCAYAMGCRRFESGCDASCPMTDEYPASPAELVEPQYHQRVSALKQAGPIAFVSPSNWLAEQAQQGMLRDQQVHAIPNSVELSKFIPIEKRSAREALGLPTGRPVLITTATPGDPRKGADVLHQAMNRLTRPNTIVLQLGGNPDTTHAKWNHRVLTGMTDPRLLRLAYSAADVHVLPTLADNLPNTLLEAAACGVPSIASDVGGVSEAIDDGKTGWLVPAGDVGAYANRIGQVIDRSEQESEACRRDCRRFAEARYSPGKQAQRYTDLFSSMFETRREAA